MLLVATFSLVASMLIADAKGSELNYVTCTSVMKLENQNYQTRLHSHDVKYGTGSGQQSVTATQEKDDHNSYWVVKGTKAKPCGRGDPIECNQVIRVEHLATKKNLHSHHFTSPLSGNQEISAYGKDGNGDSGDHWKVICSNSLWERNQAIRLKHVDTEAWLSLSGQTFGRPISGQMEVVGSTYADSSSYWKAREGVFVKPADIGMGSFVRDDSARKIEHNEL
ncbi:stromal cell-derived factor 2-like [Tropilaelaps mercedesae]|uniref:Stromal cell-derived factor 2-like n=1 Tax=Tropilaelaps mercedesae TaxID=418985 RepID=A0A1V9XPL8_9ACAR|nr:stromal cell-derived factor 2-like [Tropilaelaps mercedesae]